jgi:uncharacterized protein
VDLAIIGGDPVKKRNLVPERMFCRQKLFSSKAFCRTIIVQKVKPMDLQALLEQKRDQVLETAAHYGAYDVCVFGSVARGEANAASDIDLLVKLEPGRSLMDLGGLLYDLQNLLGTSVDVVTEKGLRPRIREQVLREAVPL